MSTHVIKMPDIGEGIAEVELVAWHVKPGDAVAPDQALADVMTDKASVEIPSPAGGTAVSLGGARRKIAQKMQEAKRRIPHFTSVEEIDVTELEALRAGLNVQWAGRRSKLTLLPFLLRAMVRAVREFPQVNARFDDEAGIVTR